MVFRVLRLSLLIPFFPNLHLHKILPYFLKRLLCRGRVLCQELPVRLFDVQ